jgi:hypothetical protein
VGPAEKEGITAVTIKNQEKITLYIKAREKMVL